MAKELTATKPGTREVQRILRKQVNRAREALKGKSASASDKEVHTARKQLKKARASLRLVREGLGSRLYRKENSSFRDAARPLTEVRDAKVLLETLDDLADHFPGAVSIPALAEVHLALEEYQHEVRERVRKESSLGAVRDSLKETRKRARDWPLEGRGWSVLGAGLSRVYEAGRDAFEAARNEPSVENLHEWRKQVKYLWHQVEVLQPLWPSTLEGLAEQLHTLAGHLGDDHDLAVLRQKLQDEPGRFPDRDTAGALIGLIDRRRAELQKQAFFLGPRLYAEKPAQFAARLKGYWRAWRAEGAAGEKRG
jgi:CHAD domain-containing protein